MKWNETEWYKLNRMKWNKVKWKWNQEHVNGYKI